MFYAVQCAVILGNTMQPLKCLEHVQSKKACLLKDKFSLALNQESIEICKWSKAAVEQEYFYLHCLKGCWKKQEQFQKQKLFQTLTSQQHLQPTCVCEHVNNCVKEANHRAANNGNQQVFSRGGPALSPPLSEKRQEWRKRSFLKRQNINSSSFFSAE